MVFSSNIFLLIFLPAVFLGAQLIRNTKIQNIFLIAASLFFYAYGEGIYVLLMLFCGLITFFGVKLLQKDLKPSLRKLILAVLCIASLGLLFVFKYAVIFGADISLPIGISFFTFQAISLCVDAYRRNSIPDDVSITDVLLYITFFPQLIAGPIVRFQDILPSLRERTVSGDDCTDGLYRFCLGLGKKVIIANALALLSPFRSWTGAVSYMLQIYFDFSGYSDMAIGLGMMFGFKYRENFNNPYCASSPKDFWRRWHISLSEWFRDYLYIPLGGNRKGMRRTFLNVMIVFLCTGIWHGAGITFVIWGVWNGIFVATEGLIEKLRVRKTACSVPAKAAGTIFTLLFVLIGFVIFKSETLGEALETYKNMFSFTVNKDVFGMFDLRMCVIFVSAIILASPGADYLRNLTDKVRRPFLLKSAVSVVLLAVCVAILFAGSYNPFIYFRF